MHGWASQWGFCVPKAMLKITVDGLTGKLTWNDKGQVQKEPTAYVITDGKYVQA